MIAESAARQKLAALLLSDSARMQALELVSRLQIPDAWLAAGFLRNLAWDHQHNFESTPLNDIDVIFFDRGQQISEWRILDTLNSQMSDFQWDVKNQARMHLRNQHQQYRNSIDAMSYWPEKETAVAVRLTQSGYLQFAAPFGLARLFANSLTYNNKRTRQLFESRLQKKQWLNKWYKLRTCDE